MCSIQTKHRLHNTNRVIIAVLTIIGLLMDNYQHSDIIFGLSVFIWVWLPECDKMEEKTLDIFSLVMTKITSGFSKKSFIYSTQARRVE